MKAGGYKVEEYDTTHHDEYLKPPVYNFEMHVALVSERDSLKGMQYYSDVKERLCIKDEDNEFGYHLRDEDFYVYMVFHAFKHYDRGGTGLRTLADFYIYNRAKESSMDWDYIRQELVKLDVLEFESNMRLLSQKVFANSEYMSEESFSTEELELLGLMIYSGTYGTKERNIGKRIQKFQADDEPIRKNTKIKYTLGRVFPGVKYLEEFYPIVRKHKWAIPFVYVMRMFRGISSQRKKIKGEFKAVWKKL